MNYQHIQVERDEHLLTITIDRPEVLNAVSPATNFELEAAFNEFEADDELWVAIITGAGDKAFCTGGDISQMVGAEDEDDFKVPPTGWGGLTSRRGLYKPVIAAVNGMAFGGGFEIALAADLIIASDQASFGLPEPKIGTAALAGGMHRLVRQIGVKPAMGMLLSGDPVDAQRAYQLGLVNKLVSPDQVMEAARHYAKKIISSAPLAIQATKQCAMEGLNLGSLENALRAQQEGDFELLDKMLMSEDIREGINAFMEKRAPEWQNR
jgi:crotonobetainyl-CoA hydratase